jgi:putative ABC transport system permease protein
MSLFSRLGSVFRNKELDQDLEDELRAHLEMRAQDEIEAGMSEEEARLKAARRFGNPTLVREHTRRAHLVVWLETVLQDLRHGQRTLRKSPAFTMVAVSSLALGIGLNTAVFSLVDTLLFRRVQRVDTARLVSLYRVSTKGEMRGWFPYPVIRQLREGNNVFAGTAAWTDSVFSVSFNGEPPQMERGSFYSGNYYALLGVQPWLGRTFTSEDDQPGAAPVAMISYEYWQKNFNADSGVLGRTIHIKGTPFQIIGVIPPGFTGLTVLTTRDQLPQIALPLTWYSSLKLNDNNLSADIVARLKPGTPVEQATAEANLILHRMPSELLRTDYSEDLQQGLLSDSVELHPRGQGDEWAWLEYKLRLSLLMGVVGLVLLIACANIANLLLARAGNRRQEIAVRLAIGAARSRVVRQLVTESLLLAGLGGIAGIGLAMLVHRGLIRLFELDSGFNLDWRVLVFTAGVSLLAGAFFGLAPAFRGTRLDLSPCLKGESAQTATAGARSGHALGKSLVAIQVAVSLMLIVGTGLLIQTLRNLTRVDPGFDQHNVLLFWIYPTTGGYQGSNELRLYSDYLRRFNSIPGVVKASMARHYMMQRANNFRRVSLPSSEGAQAPESMAAFNAIAPDFFATMRIPLLAGRDFSVHDGAGSAKVAIVDQAFANSHFGGENPLGQHIVVHTSEGSVDLEIVGIAHNVRFHGVREDDDDVPSQEEVFVPYTQAGSATLGQMCFALRTVSNPMSVLKTVQQEAQAVDKNLPLVAPFTQVEVGERSTQEEHSLVILTGSFSSLAVLLACIGLYGVMAYTVSRRTREIGVRMALGATQPSIRRMFLRESGLLVSAGIVVGIPVTLTASRLLRSVLYGVGPSDLSTFFFGTALLAAVAALAAYLPARRASRVDPMVALRNE